MQRLDRYLDMLSRRGRVILALLAVCMISSVIGILRVSIDTDFSLFMPEDAPSVQILQTMSDTFEDSGQLLVLVPAEATAESLRSVGILATELSALDGVSAAAGPIPQALLAAGDDELLSASALLESISGVPTVYRSQTDERSWAIIRVTLVERESTTINQSVASIKEYLDTHQIAAVLSGEPYLQASIFTYILKVLLILPPLAILLLLTVFRFRIGSMHATILSMVPAITGGVLTLGLVSWVTGSLTVMTVLVPIFIIVLGSADGLHVTSHVMDQLSQGLSNREALKKTLEAVGTPIILTSITTMAGFLAMLVIDSQAIREMGIAAAMGIAIACVATWIILPVLLIHQRPLTRSRDTSSGLVTRFFTVLRGWRSVVLTLILVIACIPGMLKLQADFSMMDMYKRSTVVRKNISLVSEITGGALPVNLLFHIPEGGSLDAATANAVLTFQRRIAQEGVGTAGISLYTLIAGMAGSVSGVAAYPASPLQAQMIYDAFKLRFPEMLSSLESDSGWGRAMILLPNLDDTTLQAFIDIALEIQEETGVELYPAGTAFAMKDLNDQIIPQQISSLLLAVLLVGALTVITQRSLRLGFLTVIPIIITLFGLFGFLGYSGIALSIITSIMTGLTVGVGIDYAIHYVSMYQWAQRSSSATPALDALDYVATPVLANALGLAIGFTVMLFSPFQVHVTLSSLMWVTMLLSAFLSLSLLPTLLGAGKERR